MADPIVIDPSDFAPTPKGAMKVDPAEFKPMKGPEGPTEISSGPSEGQNKNFWDTKTENLAQHAYSVLNRHGHPDLAEAAHQLISKAGPHNLTDVVLGVVSSAMPA